MKVQHFELLINSISQEWLYLSVLLKIIVHFGFANFDFSMKSNESLTSHGIYGVEIFGMKILANKDILKKTQKRQRD